MSTMSMVSLFHASKYLPDLVMIVNICFFMIPSPMITCHACTIHKETAQFRNILFGDTHRTPTPWMSIFIFSRLLTILCMIVQVYENIMLFLSMTIEFMLLRYNFKHLMLSKGSITFVIGQIFEYLRKINLANTNSNKKKHSKSIKFYTLVTIRVSIIYILILKSIYSILDVI